MKSSNRIRSHRSASGASKQSRKTRTQKPTASKVKRWSVSPEKKPAKPEDVLLNVPGLAGSRFTIGTALRCICDSIAAIPADDILVKKKSDYWKIHIAEAHCIADLVTAGQEFPAQLKLPGMAGEFEVPEDRVLSEVSYSFYMSRKDYLQAVRKCDPETKLSMVEALVLAENFRERRGSWVDAKSGLIALATRLRADIMLGREIAPLRRAA